MTWRAWAAAAWAALAFALPAAAQEQQLAPSEALSCMTPAERSLPYPTEALERKYGGTVKVRLKFRGPQSAPSVEFEDDLRSSTLLDAVRSHVTGFRVPCMKPDDTPVVLTMSFVFVPNDGRKVVSTLPVDARSAERASLLACTERGSQSIEYPYAARRKEVQGNVLLKLRYVAPDRPPEVTTIAVPRGGEDLERAARRALESWRLPCMKDEPIETAAEFRFWLVDGDRVLLKDMSLRQFVLGAKDKPRGVYFDLKTTGCPFDIRLRYQRPWYRSSVGELETTDPARRPFLEWLSQVTLALDDEVALQVYGQTIDLHVPCTTIDL